MQEATNVRDRRKQRGVTFTQSLSNQRKGNTRSWSIIWGNVLLGNMCLCRSDLM